MNTSHEPKIILLILLAACLPPLPPGDDTSGGSGGSSGVTTTSGAATISGASSSGESSGSADSSGGDELCTFHCFSGTPVSFPYSLNPVDQEGTPSVVPLSCDLVGGGTLNLLGTSFPIDEPTCAFNQTLAEQVEAIGVCAPGVVAAPPSMEWEEWASRYAADQQRFCVGVLVEMGCLSSVPAPAVGAEELCNAYLRNQLRLDVLAVSPQFEEVEPIVTPPLPGETCDYVDNLECG